MLPPTDLCGQEAVLAHVTDLLRAGQSVLLFGPEAIGKSAIAEAVTYDGLVVIDPLERVSSHRASSIRRALDRGVVHLVAARVSRGHELGSVGRILWRFAAVRVRELPARIIRRIVINEMQVACNVRIDATWVQDAAKLSKGRPGFALAIARFSADWMRTHEYLPTPAFAFAAICGDETIRALGGMTHAHRQHPQQ